MTLGWSENGLDGCTLRVGICSDASQSPNGIEFFDFEKFVA
jgi:hypothetical protein